MTPREILAVSPIVPVVAIQRAEDAAPLARALLDGGVGIIEITLRTPAALDAIRAVSIEVPEMVVGAGTVLGPLQFEASLDAGSQFVITPGCTPDLLGLAQQVSIPLIPGVATASEIMTAMTAGLDTFKLFPAQIAGGITALKAFSGPFKEVRFCPTGGINAQNMAEYLTLQNVLCVGGSWLTPTEAIDAGDFAQVTRLCEMALKQQ
jgi:2-dehydro-3-deoxyphosphogluconate aldolase/(4S)-4-hydroxy-2-oxoglutarate aldolase